MALTEKQKQQRIDYARKNLKRIPLDVQKEKYTEKYDNGSVNGFIKRAIDNQMERDNAEDET